MSESIYERYKAALRRGHLAVLRGQLETALDAYRDAAAVVPERALPHTSIGAVELRLGRPTEALAAFEAALERSPNDEAALSGRADALAALGQRAAAAETLDRLAGLLEADGRIAEACQVVARALELAESRSRRQLMAVLTERLRASPPDAAAEAALARAVRVLEERGGPALEAPARSRGDGERQGPATAEPGLAAVAVPAVAPSSEETRPAEPSLPETGPGEPRLLQPGAPEPKPADEVVRLTLAAEEALEAGDRAAAVDRFLEAAAAHAAAGRLTAALDACARVVAAYPDALEAQEALVHLYLELEWRALAVEKVALLERLSAFGSDPLLRARILLLANELALEPEASATS